MQAGTGAPAAQAPKDARAACGAVLPLLAAGLGPVLCSLLVWHRGCA